MERERGRVSRSIFTVVFFACIQKDTPAVSRRGVDESGCDRLLVGALDGRDDVRGDVLDSIQRRGKRLALAVVELDVVARGRACLQPDGLADDESDCFGFGFPHGLAGGALVATMQKLVGEFMDDD